MGSASSLIEPVSNQRPRTFGRAGVNLLCIRHLSKGTHMRLDANDVSLLTAIVAAISSIAVAIISRPRGPHQ
jgi:hypothetical protein